LSINILKNYTSRILGFSLQDFRSILTSRSRSYVLEHKGVNLFLIKNQATNSLKPLPCISKVYTNAPNGKALKIANNNSKCYMSSKSLGVEAQFNNCDICHMQCIEEYDKGRIYLVKK